MGNRSESKIIPLPSWAAFKGPVLVIKVPDTQRLCVGYGDIED